MSNMMMKKILGLTGISAALVLSGCALKSQGTASISIKIPGKGSSTVINSSIATLASTQSGGTSVNPASLAEVDCYVINVMADDILQASWDKNSSSEPKAELAAARAGEPCAYPGVMSKVVPASATGSTVSIQVPVGKKRLFQLLGFKSVVAGSCAQPTDAASYFEINSGSNPIELGRAESDIEGSTVISLNGKFDPARSFQHCSTNSPCKPEMMALSPFAKGTGSSADPYLICTPQQFLNMGSAGFVDTINLFYALGKDLDFTGISYTPIGSSGTVFQGRFDGWGRAISNITYNSGASQKVGLFGVIGPYGSVNSFRLSNARFIADSYIGLVAGVNYGRIERVDAQGSIKWGNGTAAYVGGIAGMMAAHPGITGSGFQAMIGDSFSDLSAVDNPVAGTYIGGLVGAVYVGALTPTVRDVTIVHSMAKGSVGNATYSMSNVGGIVGLISENGYASGAAASVAINDCGSHLAVNAMPTGSANHGGIAGAYSPTSSAIAVSMNRVYTAASLPITSKGGVFGDYPLVTGVQNVNLNTSVFYDSTATSGVDNGTGTGAYVNPGTPAQSTAIMMGSSIYSTWDTAIWNIGGGYPTLKPPPVMP